MDAALLRSRAIDVLAGIACGAAERERQRALPHEQVREVAVAQLLAWRIPTSHGGAGATVKDVMSFVVDLAAADSNVAQALRPSFSFTEGLAVNGSETDRQRWYPRLLEGAVIGNAGWEVGGANGAITARLTQHNGHFVAHGSKYYSTGSLYADWVTASALDDNGHAVSFIVPATRDGLRLHDDFDAMGQRLTASGTTDLDALVVYPEELRQRHTQGVRSPVTAFLQLYLAAVLAGIARNALTDAVAYTRTHARPIKHSPAATAAEDPYVQLAVGEISAHAFAASAVVKAAASTLDSGDLDEASVAVAQAQFIAASSALRASELVFDAGGGSATSREHNLDRHWRNARTVANHNPRLWKAAVAGAYHLTGTPPPFSGLF